MSGFADYTITQPRIVERAVANLPQATQAALFTIAGGKVLITAIYGEVNTTAIEAQETVIKLVLNPTVGADVDFGESLDINADTVGTIYNITGTLSDAIVATTSGGMIAQASPIVAAAGTIDLDTDDDSSTGKIMWVIHYSPLDLGATIVAA